ncbi:peptide/nickel transport system ATP-binding protein [Agrobacterium larrymoorei]|uniref:Glutathione import ATP-binding protein GsiA n=1 Tax=Agrobacterium larrymoorei TaxID=160699 RepID=A0AAJ2B8U4_9HYPH|nr:ABC transporter ATP-binding protein [Agrobacterium larrymoorei]MDR6101641.1 peptide/nickel transport system ATP-binding protein [Agrobacterium larrymoorei]
MTEATPHPVLSIRDLKISFLRDGKFNAIVRDLNLDIHAGETLAIVGESGSGKSVSALSVMQLLPQNASRIEGSIKLKGEELIGTSPSRMREIRGNQIAMIFQEPMTSLNPVLTVGEQIAEPLIAHRGISKKEARRETLKLMEKVRIPSAARRIDDYPHQFSGGMRQRVMIAIALACRPALLIADEPTTALDVTIQAQILDLIKTLQEEEGTAVLFITHDMGVVAEIADRTMVLYRGDQIETGATTDVFAAPKRPYTRALLSAVPQLGSAGGGGPRPFPVIDMETGHALPVPPRQDTVDTSGIPLLEVEKLSGRFEIRSPYTRRVQARIHAVENVSFSLARGETLAIVGESGCGKSTTGRLLAGLNNPQSGSIRINGNDVKSFHRADLSRQVQMIFQDPFASLNPRLTVENAIAEPLLIHGLDTVRNARQRARDLLADVGLSADMAKRYPHEFSGGQRQRICIARALALEPSLIIADEAVSALDVSVKAQVVNLMLDLQEKLKLGFLFISHDMAVVERISHRVAVMYLGEIVETGPREAVFSNPQHPYTQRLLSAVPLPDPSRRKMRHKLPVGELRSPVRDKNFSPPARSYREVSPGHVVQVWSEDSF